MAAKKSIETENFLVFDIPFDNGECRKFTLIITIKHRGDKYGVFFPRDETTAPGMYIEKIKFHFLGYYRFEYTVPNDIVNEVCKIARKKLRETYYDIELSD